MTLDITVVIPTYNRFELLKEAVDSVRRQTCRVAEIIVVDDGSTDQTVDWCRNQPDLSLCSTTRGGPSVARNLGVTRAKTTWIAFLDSDDVWDDHHIQKAKDVIQQRPDCRFALFNFKLTDKELVETPGLQGFVGAFPAFRGSRKLFSKIFPIEKKTDVWHGPALAQALCGNWLQPSGLVIERNLFLHAGGFNEELWRCEDMDLLLKLVCLSPATLIMTPSYRWRQGQADSLAADAFAHTLKRVGLSVMVRRGFGIVLKETKYLPLWMLSVAWMIGDLGFSFLLRHVRRLESQAHIQSAVQTLISILNIAVPILLAHKYMRTEFANYRMFSIYLSSVSALSLTSGLWSMIPYWQAQKGAETKVATAWKLQCLAGLLVATYILITSRAHGGLSTPAYTLCLAISAVFLLPSLFLEQRLCYARRGLLSACMVAAVELLRSGCMLLLAWKGHSLVYVLSMIPTFLGLRAITLYFTTQRCCPLRAESNRWESFRTTFWESLPIGLATAMTTLSSVFDRLYLSRRLSAEQFSTIAAGSISLPVIMLLEQALVQNSIPQIAKRLQQNEHSAAVDLLKGIIEKISRLAIPFTAFLILFAADIMHVIFSDRYSDAVNVFRIFSLSNLLSCITPDVISRALGRSRRILFFSCLTATLTVICFTAGFVLLESTLAILFGLSANLIVRIIFLYSDLKLLKTPITYIIPSLKTLVQTMAMVFLLIMTKIFSLQVNLLPIETIIVSLGSMLMLFPHFISNVNKKITPAQERPHEKK